MADLVLREDQDGIAILTLNRPELLNALSPNLFVELRDQIDAIHGQIDAVGCVILRGEGRSFSAGNDLNAIKAGERAPSAHFQAETLEAIERLPQPVIAAVQGHCYTGSLELVLACDLLVAAESAKFADTHGKWAMTPVWGMSQRLPRRIGPVRAKELMFTGRVVSGQESVALGLANYCVPDEELTARSLELAREIVQNSWHTLRGDKTLILAGQQQHLDDGLQYERDNSPGSGPDLAERLAQFGKS
jgi:enoyl-CoA hydratase/carnithine racemase|tara:strand:+ start:1014 stop:1754 length:741 start_codon:yes stop_codon:yes gene_type:complete